MSELPGEWVYAAGGVDLTKPHHAVWIVYVEDAPNPVEWRPYKVMTRSGRFLAHWDTDLRRNLTQEIYLDTAGMNQLIADCQVFLARDDIKQVA